MFTIWYSRNYYPQQLSSYHDTLTQRLPITLIPEQFIVTLVSDYMIYDSCRLDPTFLVIFT